MNMPNELIGSGAVARCVGLERWQLLYLLDSKQLPEPSFNVSGRRLFTPEDVRAIEAALAKRPHLTGEGKATNPRDIGETKPHGWQPRRSVSHVAEVSPIVEGDDVKCSNREEVENA